MRASPPAPGVMYVAMEFAKHGDLRTFLRHSRRLTSVHEYDNTSGPTVRAALRPETLLNLALGTARGLQHLSDKQVRVCVCVVFPPGRDWLSLTLNDLNWILLTHIVPNFLSLTDESLELTLTDFF